MKNILLSIYHIKLYKALLISLVIITVLITFIARAYYDFSLYKKHIDPALTLTIERLHFFIKNNLIKEKNKLFSKADTMNTLKSFYIHVDQKDIQILNSDLPDSGKEQYINGYMKISKKNELYKIKLRYRGNNPFHWLYDQKSLRIKLENNHLYQMETTFNLINPPHEFSIIDTISYAMSRELGVMSPKFYHVKVYINNKYMGVYLYLSQADESLLRSYKRMPGSIYSGDAASIGTEDGTSALWFDSIYWEKKSSRNAEQKNNRVDIDFFIKTINQSNDIEFYHFINNFFDKDKLYSYMALDTLLGTNHHDYAHNHKYYFDPYKGQFEPIEWDPRFWTGDSDYKDLSVYKLLNRLRLNPLLENERDIIAYNVLQKYPADIIFKRLEDEKKKVINDLRSDIYRDIAVRNRLFKDWIAIPMDINSFENMIAKFKETLHKRQKFLKSEYNKSTITYTIKEIKKDSYQIIFEINGNSGVEVNFDRLLTAQIPYDLFRHGGKETINTIQRLFPGRKIVKGSLKNWPEWFVSSHHIETAPLYYRFIINGAPSFTKKDIKVTNLVTGKTLSAQYVNDISASKQADSLHPWLIPTPKLKTKVLKGLIDVNQTLVFDKHTAVSIEPGTIFKMHANQSIYFYGKVTALGTKEKPVKFISEDPQKPWGIVAIQGKATTGSKFEFVEFENGSIDTRNLIDYTSPFNIHDMDWFEVRHCKIGQNFVGDDSMHIAYAKGIVDNSEFHNARSDGLDIDISEVNLTNNIFFKSGNDGLDVMTTKIDASNNVFIDTGDKGISVGEWSEATITSSFFLRTVIGLEVKDKSRVKADNLIFVDSKEKSINLYNKNKRYDEGGFLDADFIYMLGNTKVKTDKRSGTTIQNQIKNQLPELQKFQWYSDLNNTPYLQEVQGVEAKYAQ